MQIFLINLARRPDRLAAMTEAARRLGLNFTRMEALDAKIAGGLQDQFDDKGPLGEIPRGDKACLLSHRAAWDAFMAGGDEFAAVLEDDVILSPSAARFLQNADWLPPGTDLVKLEQYGPPGQSVLLSDFRDAGEGFRIARMHSRHTGAAAYILSRRAAQILLAERHFNLPVDHLLFNSNNSRLFAKLSPWQLLPAVARQREFVGAASDIEGTRVALRKWSLTYMQRELIRFGYDLKLLPRQLELVISGKARFTRIGTET
ncbi:MAG TPA: glycosyltransferase family 25 protein [Rhizomicrobium sp.]|jgi:glycosyl transferase family 25|nr:glycosyltransferase family 25 protein [Rhizomicrobium sp.]